MNNQDKIEELLNSYRNYSNSKTEQENKLLLNKSDRYRQGDKWMYKDNIEILEASMYECKYELMKLGYEGELK